ncbi:endonuclease/exonuclease/phosphatase family protein [Acinetobacter sp. LMB-5]|uniref:endonuclease/exonuclease/phosphatase family protein n=1 Tax=Acinetobacter sp. LMB-5 TaxID=1609919 RepID=UPI0007620921|nr:endonuclease/exonuclease/phosphatase family protein [Acinetobacter sp. LMB-5]
MSLDSLSLIWWNTSLSPPTEKKDLKEKPLTKEEQLNACAIYIESLFLLNYDFICLGEISPSDINHLISLLNVVDSNYSYISGAEKVGRLIFDTCIFFKKEYALIEDSSQTKNFIYSIGGRNIKSGQRYEFELPYSKSSLVFYLSHWPSRQTCDDSLYNNIAQSIRVNIEKDLLSSKHVILLGDYNVEPHHTSIVSCLQSSREKTLVKYRKFLFYNPCWKFLSSSQYVENDNQLFGTYRLRKSGLFSDWHTIDQILICKKFLLNEWNFKDEHVKIIDVNSSMGLQISDHAAVSFYIERKIK